MKTFSKLGSGYKYFFTRLIIGMALYMIILPISLILLRSDSLGVFQIPIGLAPALPIAYLIWSYKKSLALMDEFNKHIHVKSILFATSITLIASVLIAFFENAGLPPLTFHVFTIMNASWGLAFVYNNWKYR